MDKNLDNIDDLFDDKIHHSLRSIGMIFPHSMSDFKALELELVGKSLTPPSSLADPKVFLGKRHYTNISTLNEKDAGYSQHLAQAAREGNTISEDIKSKMAEDKKKTTGNNSDNY